MARQNYNIADSGSAYTSADLVRDAIYTREDLISAYKISDMTINTGVFRPAGKKSIWLFVTQEKSADRTQYVDQLIGDTLHWQGQTSGRTDGIIKLHKLAGDELIIFFRKKKSEHSNCSIPDDHIDPRRSAFFMARSVLRDIRGGMLAC